MGVKGRTQGDYRFENGWLIHDLAEYALGNEVSRATVFALANGYMGVRGAAESAPLERPGVVGQYVNGLYDTPTGGILDREMINLPAWTAIQLEMDGCALNLTGTEREDYTRVLDMQRGVLRQSARWLTPDHKEVTLHSERFVSMARPHLAAIRWQLEAGTDCTITIRSAIDSAVTNRFADRHFAQVSCAAGDRGCSVEVTTIEPGYRAIVAAAHALADATSEVVWRGETTPQRAATHNRLAHQQPADWRTFFEGFRAHFWLSWRWGLMNVGGFGFLGNGLWFYSRVETAWANWVHAILLGMLILWAILQLFTYPLLLEQEDRRPQTAVRNSLVILVRRPLVMLGTSAGLIALILLSVSVFLPAWFLITGSLCAYVANRAVVDTIQRIAGTVDEA